MAADAMRKWIFRGLLTIAVGAVGWHLTVCLVDQRNAVMEVKAQMVKVRAGTQKYFDEQDAFYDRTLAFLDRTHDGKRTVALVEGEKEKIIAAINTLIQECIDLRIARYDFVIKWNRWNPC